MSLDMRICIFQNHKKSDSYRLSTHGSTHIATMRRRLRRYQSGALYSTFWLVIPSSLNFVPFVATIATLSNFWENFSCQDLQSD